MTFLAQAFDDPRNWIQIVIFAIIILGWIVRAIVSAARGRGGARGAEGGPRKGLRDFLEEVRKAAEEESQRKIAPKEPAPEEAPRPVATSPADERLAERRRASEARRRALAERRARVEAERAEREAAEREAAMAEQRDPDGEWSTVADRKLESSVAGRSLHSTLEQRELASQLEQRTIVRAIGHFRSASKKASGRPRRALVGGLAGLTMRELILAQTILGPPRCQREGHREM